MGALYDPREPWQPIELAPRDGTSILILYTSGRIEIGRWEHNVRTRNGAVVYDVADWFVPGASPLIRDERLEPLYFARIPALPPRGKDGYVIAASEGRHA